MGEIKREHVNSWKEASRTYLLENCRLTAPTAAFGMGGQPNLHCRNGRDRFLSRVRQRLLRLISEAAGHGESALQHLERTFYSHLAFIARHPEAPRRILAWSLQSSDARLRHRVQKVIAHYEFRVLRLVAEGQRQGCIRSDIEPRAATSLFVGMLQKLVLTLSSEGLDSEAMLNEAGRLFSTYLELVRPNDDTRGTSCEPKVASSPVSRRCSC